MSQKINVFLQKELMTEFFFIFIQFFIIFFLLSFNIYNCLPSNFKLNKFSLPENITFNTIIFLNFILIISFFNVRLNTIIISYFLYVILLLIIYLYRFKTLSVAIEKNLYLFLLLFFTSLIIFFEVSNNLVVGWDAQQFWIYKTLNFQDL